MVHSIYNPGFPDERKNDKYIVAIISCRGFSLDFPNGDVNFIRAMRQDMQMLEMCLWSN